MLSWASGFFAQPHAALLAALLTAIDVEIPDPLVTHVFDIIAAIVAIIGFLNTIAHGKGTAAMSLRSAVALILILLAAPAAAQMLPQVTNNSALQALPSRQFPAVYRLGYAAPDDGGAAIYTGSTLACSLNGGNGDNGSQVKAQDGGCWLAKMNNKFDPRAFGAVCGGADVTVPLQATIDASLRSGGGTVIIPCPLTIAGQVNVGVNGTQGGLRIAGIGPMYFPAASATPGTPSPGNVAWPATVGSAVICTATGADACLMVNAAGIEIDHINFGNIQPTPPDDANYQNWHPTVYPFIIGTRDGSAWQGLYLHDLTFTSTSRAIDLEGAATYQTWNGTQITVDHIWCDPCLNTGIRIDRIDNQQFYSHLMFVPTGYYFDKAAVGYYLRQNAIGLDISYSAAFQAHDLNFFAQKIGIQIRNADVTNNFGHLIIGMSAGEMTNVMFNEVCQAVAMPDGDQTNAQFKMVNVDIWPDESGFQCAKGKAIFDMPSNKVDASISHVNVNAPADTFATIGCGQPGTAGCGLTYFPAPTLRLADINVYGYGHYTAGAPFIKAPSTTLLVMPTDLRIIRPEPKAGPIIGAGQDGTTACMAPLGIGGGTKAAEGAVIMQGSCNDTTHTGYVSFWDTNNQRHGYIGYTDTAETHGLELSGDSGPVSIDAGGGGKITLRGYGDHYSIINLGNLPVNCTGLPAGTLYADNGAVRYCPRGK
jgi:hypothetical protein